MSLHLREIEPALYDPAFHPATCAILVVDLPELEVHTCKAVPLAKVMGVVAEIVTEVRAGDLARWQVQLDKCVSEGLTPCVKISGTSRDSWIRISGTRITAAAKA